MANSEVMAKSKIEFQAPPMFKVIYVDDTKTTTEFVIESLIDYFNYGEGLAERIAQELRTKGSATAAVLPFELAEQKGMEVTAEARKNGYPLQVYIEPEN